MHGILLLSCLGYCSRLVEPRGLGGCSVPDFFSKIDLLQIDNDNEKKKVAKNIQIISNSSKTTGNITSVHFNHKTNFDWHCIFSNVFYLLPWRLLLWKTIFHKTMPFAWRYKQWGYIPLGSNHTFSIGAMFKHWTYFKFLSIVFHFPYCIGYIWKQPLKGAHWNMCSLKLGKQDTLNKDTNILQW